MSSESELKDGSKDAMLRDTRMRIEEHRARTELHRRFRDKRMGEAIMIGVGLTIMGAAITRHWARRFAPSRYVLRATPLIIGTSAGAVLAYHKWGDARHHQRGWAQQRYLCGINRMFAAAIKHIPGDSDVKWSANETFREGALRLAGESTTAILEYPLPPSELAEGYKAMQDRYRKRGLAEVIPEDIPDED